MTKIFLDDDPDLEIFLRKTINSRRITLRISALDGKITMTGPSHLDFEEFKNFAESKKSWLRSKKGSFEPLIFVSNGIKIPILGTETKVLSGKVQKPKKIANILYVNKKLPVSKQVKNYLTEICGVHLKNICNEFAKRLGSKFYKISLRDTRSRWGSCSNEANLMFSWRLVMAPEDILTYVAAHEVAHLKHMNHSKEFWETLEFLFGPYEKQKIWLKQNGPSLHRYKFES